MAREGYAHETRRAVHVTLKMALKQAFRRDLLRRNPADRVDAPKGLGEPGNPGEDEGEIRHLTDEQARALFAATAGSRWGGYYVVAVRT